MYQLLGQPSAALTSALGRSLRTRQSALTQERIQGDGWPEAFRRLRHQPWWPWLRPILLVIVYSMVLVSSRWLAYQIRFDFSVPASQRTMVFQKCMWVLCSQLMLLAASRQFSGVTRYFNLPEVKQLAQAMAGSALLLFALHYIRRDFYSPPRGVILIESMLGFGGLCLIRLTYRAFHDHCGQKTPGQLQHVGIIGAGDVGSSLVLELNHRPGLGLKPVLFLDDDRKKWGSYLHGVPVRGPIEALNKWSRAQRLSKIIIAMPSAPAKRLAVVARLAQQQGLSCVTVPAIDQLTSGRVSVNQLRPISIEDLLGREPVSLDNESIRRTFENRVVMVTGAGGSIGSELCRQIAACSPMRLLLVERCEVQLFQIEQEMIKRGYGNIIVPFVADILDQVRMRAIFEAHQPTVVLHAAAHKHVPLMEHQPREAVMNNSIGTARLADLALTFGVERFLMISSDKAVNPTSVMGATKRLAEIYLQALFAQHPQATKFICVRFGNVLGSSGSVVPTFAQQIAAGGPVTVTHPDMVRYFMTIPEAVGLVLQGCAQGEGGEIFVLDMGEPVKIAALARQMIELSGLRPEVDVEIEYMGLRPGEKLFEELRCRGEDFRPTVHPRIMSFVNPPESLARLGCAFARLEEEIYSLQAVEVRQRIRSLVPEYLPCTREGNRAALPPIASGTSPCSDILPKRRYPILPQDASAAVRSLNASVAWSLHANV
jgi:FlaA1/EpsC-like NDP-sugar epimerase